MAGGVRYLVRRAADAEYRQNAVPEPAVQYTAAFATRDAAAEHARQLDQKEKEAFGPAAGNPFHSHTYDELTSLPPFALRDWLRDAGLEPPPEVPPTPDRWAEDRCWREWWEGAKATGLTADQWRRVWEGLNRHSFFEVTEADAGEKIAAGRPVVYAVVHQHWEYDDCNYCGANDALTVYRTHAKAEAEAKRRTAEVRTDPAYQHWNGGPNQYVVVELPCEAEAE